MRHSWAWPTQLGWQNAKNQIKSSFHDLVDEWEKSHFPVVVRRSNGGKDLPLGLERIPFSLPREEIQRIRGHCTIPEVLEVAPAEWRLALIALEKSGLSFGVYGSLAWQALTKKTYLKPSSDIDLIFRPRDRLELEKGLELLQNSTFPLDGEVIFPYDQAVSWKELKNNAQVLVKSFRDVKLTSVAALMSTFNKKISTADFALQALYDELILYPKPGLVSPTDAGSHSDMDVETFKKGIEALKPCFMQAAEFGSIGTCFDTLKDIGIKAEEKMLQATNGVNTHRGAIFCLGLLCASIGHFPPQSEMEIQERLLLYWGKDLTRHAQKNGAREEAALGFPSIFQVALPALRKTLASGRSWECAQIDALFSLIAHIDDTNVYRRGGDEGALFVKASAQKFLARGGTGHPDWFVHAKQCHQEFIRRKLSPGGSADLLAGTCLVHRVLSCHAC